MDLLVTSNFNELTYNEQMDIDGGWLLIVEIVVLVVFVVATIV